MLTANASERSEPTAPTTTTGSTRRSDALEQHWSEMRRLSEQLTEATLVAMQVADATTPGKTLLDIPLTNCPTCNSTSNEVFFNSVSHEDPAVRRLDMQRYGRSKSIAIASMDTGCKYCSPYFYQNPLKDSVWSRPPLRKSRNVLDKKDRSFRSRYLSDSPYECSGQDATSYLGGFYTARRSGSVTELPITSSQHTQTIFSSVAKSNDIGTASSTYSRQMSKSIYAKRPGRRFQLPVNLYKSKSFKKTGLDFGLRKTLSITSAMVRMPIESATQTSKTKLDVQEIDGADKHKRSGPHNQLLNCDISSVASEGGFSHPWSIDANIRASLEEDGPHESTSSTQKRLSRSASDIERHTARLHDEEIRKSPHSVRGWQAPREGKRDVQLQTMEDFEKEISSSFHIPRILREEDQTKEPIGVPEGVLGDAADEGNDENLKARTTEYWKDQFMMFFQPSDNKLAKKLFGTKMALNKERSRQRKQGKWIIHPASNFRFYWDLLMLVLLIANLIILPIFISFFLEDLGIQAICFNCVSDTIFLLDILVNFRTGILANKFADEIILNPKQIARHYLRTWFALDFISSIPVDYIFLLLSDEAKTRSHLVSAGRALRILRLVKLLSLLRLLRITRLVRYVSQWEEFLNVANKFMGIFNLVLLMLLLGHWNACLQFLIPMLNNYPVDSWVMKCKLRDADWFEQYTWALFKAMSHMLSIGYGRFPPTSSSEAWITIISMMIGSTCYALFVGHAAALIQSFDCSKKMYREKFKQVEEYMAYRKLPRVLRQKIANYYEHRYQGKMYNENVILEELSECLRAEIVNHNCRALVAAVPFFTYADHHFVSEVIMKLKYEVFQPGDWIIKEGHLGTKMYFIQEGIVDIVDTDGRVATSLSDGSYFGEICLLTNARRVASVRAETYCNLYALDRTSFHEVLLNYPFMRRTLESVAAERLHQLGRDPMTVIHRKNIQEDLEIVKEIVSLAEKNVNGSNSDSETSSHTSSHSWNSPDKQRKEHNNTELEKVDEEESEPRKNDDVSEGPSPRSAASPLLWPRSLRTRLYQRNQRRENASRRRYSQHHISVSSRLSFLHSPRHQDCLSSRLSPPHPPQTQQQQQSSSSSFKKPATSEWLRRRHSSNATALKQSIRRAAGGGSGRLRRDTIVTDPLPMAGTSASTPMKQDEEGGEEEEEESLDCDVHNDPK